ncbi:hypothetical protein, partial [Aeromonas caviae]
AALKVEQEDGERPLCSPQEYLNQLYQQHKRKSSFWEAVRQKLPAITMSASGVQYQAENK